MKRYFHLIFWMIFIGALGVVVQFKSAIVTSDDILTGGLSGIAVGFLFGVLFSEISKK